LRRLKTMIASALVYCLARSLLATYRIRVFGLDHRTAAEGLHAKSSFCIALWHEQLFACILAHRGQPFAPLASLSSDGDIVTWVMARLGFRTVRGSSSKRGAVARDELVDVTGHGWFTAITVDGPRGPRRRVKGGVIDVARRSGVAILPLIAVADRTWVLAKSWDQFQIPRPFARIAVRYGEPITVSPDAQGLAFGRAKAQVRDAMAVTETGARMDLANLVAWGGVRG